ncbi:MAG: hypothetical protein BYD32DRAFT_223994 [Podila humilis]|nr:MAG: hypothetical protein BYD32DRAFT_223994 [Podila humilis]
MWEGQSLSHSAFSSRGKWEYFLGCRCCTAENPLYFSFTMPTRLHHNRKKRGHVSAGHGRVGESLEQTSIAYRAGIPLYKGISRGDQHSQ